MSFLYSVTGQINLTKDNKHFKIMSDCESVHVLSAQTLKKNDEVTIEKIKYIGRKKHVNQVVSTNFTVSMKSSASITLNFNCTQWGEWEAFDNDGTCRTFVMKPLHNGQNTQGVLKYKHNKTCSKFSC